VHNDSGRYPARREAFHALPRHRRSLTTAIEPLMPAANHLVAERVNRGTIEGHTKVVHVALNNRTHVMALIWEPAGFVFFDCAPDQTCGGARPPAGCKQRPICSPCPRAPIRYGDVLQRQFR
jgi:hypothetical protein